MPPFAGNAVPAIINAAVERDSSATAGPENDSENNMLARARAVGRFGNGQAVGVIRAPHLAPQRAAQVFVERFSIQPGRIRVFYQAGLCGDCAGNADSNGRRPAEFFFNPFRGFRNGTHRAFVIEARRGDTMTVQFPSVALERDEFNLCASQIHANANALVLCSRHGSRPFSGGGDILSCSALWQVPAFLGVLVQGAAIGLAFKRAVKAAAICEAILLRSSSAGSLSISNLATGA